MNNDRTNFFRETGSHHCEVSFGGTLEFPVIYVTGPSGADLGSILCYGPREFQWHTEGHACGEVSGCEESASRALDELAGEWGIRPSPSVMEKSEQISLALA